MNKETALNILNIEENELSTEEIDNRFNELKKIYDPEYKSNNMYDIISHKPDAKKYEQIVSAKASNF